MAFHSVLSTETGAAPASSRAGMQRRRKFSRAGVWFLTGLTR
ncbi:MAG: hypothetical protein U1E25_04405 [Methylocystis sp.]